MRVALYDTRRKKERKGNTRQCCTFHSQFALCPLLLCCWPLNVPFVCTFVTKDSKILLFFETYRELKRVHQSHRRHLGTADVGCAWCRAGGLRGERYRRCPVPLKPFMEHQISGHPSTKIPCANPAAMLSGTPYHMVLLYLLQHTL